MVFNEETLREERRVEFFSSFLDSTTFSTSINLVLFFFNLNFITSSWTFERLQYLTAPNVQVLLHVMLKVDLQFLGKFSFPSFNPGLGRTAVKFSFSLIG